MFSPLIVFLSALQLFPPPALASTCASPPYKYLILEGGGVKGIAYGGSVAALEAASLLADVEGFAGSSAGSQAAALLAAGYSAAELTKQLVNIDFSTLMDRNSWNPLEEVQGLVENYGWFKGEVLQRQIDDLLLAKTGLRNTTFAQLQQHTGKSLTVTATCVTTQLLTWFSHTTTPDMPVALAVRASSSIPFFYQPVVYSGEMYVDGGCIRNLPFDAFEEGSGSILALSLRGGVGTGRVEINNFMEFASSLAETVIFGPSTANRLVAEEDDEDLDLVSIDYGDVGTVDFGLTMTKKVWLVEQGFWAVQERLKECGRGGVDALPESLISLKEEARKVEEREELEREKVNYDQHITGVREAVGEFASQFEECMVANGGKVGKCGIDGVIDVVKDGSSAVYHIKLLLAMAAGDKRVLGVLLVFVIGAGGVIGLAGVGAAVIRKQRKERKLKEKVK